MFVSVILQKTLVASALCVLTIFSTKTHTEQQKNEDIQKLLKHLVKNYDNKRKEKMGNN